MGRTTRALSVWVLVMTVGIGASVSSAWAQDSGSNNVVVQRLIDGSPWKGTWAANYRQGTMEVVFFREGGKLQARTQNITNASTPGGNCRDLSISGKKIRFINVSGARYELALDGQAIDGYSYWQGYTSRIVLKSSR